MGLPAFLLSKSLYSDSIGMFQLHWNVSGGTYPIALRDLAFQLGFQKLDPFAFGSFKPAALSIKPLEIKNPASSAGLNRHTLAVLRDARFLSTLCS